MFCAPVTSDEITNNKVPGIDNISAKVLKIINEYTAIPLEYIFNLSFSTGIVPDLLGCLLDILFTSC